MNLSSLNHKNKLSTYLLDEDLRFYYGLLMIYSGILAPLIGIVTSFTYWAIVLYPGFRSGYYYILGSISFADFLTGAYCLPMYVLSCHPHTNILVFGTKLACLARLTCLELAGGASIVCMYLLTVDRFIAVMNPRKYSKIVTNRKVLKVIVFTWLLAMLWSSLPMMSWNRYDAHIELLDRRCYIHRSLPETYVFILVCKVPAFLGIATLLSAWFVCATLCHQKTFKKNSDTFSPENCIKTEDRFRSVAVTFTLLLMFVVVWGTYILIVPLEFVQLFNRKQNELLVVSSHLLVFNFALVKPAAYVLLQQEFRQVIKVMLTTCPCRWRARLSKLHEERYTIKIDSRMEEAEAQIHKLVPTLSETFDMGGEVNQIALYSRAYKESVKGDHTSLASHRSSDRSLKAMFRRKLSSLSLGRTFSFTSNKVNEEDKTLSTFTINSPVTERESLASRKRRLNFGSSVDKPTDKASFDFIARDASVSNSSRSSKDPMSSSGRPILKNKERSPHGSLPSNNSNSELYSSQPGTDDTSNTSAVARQMKALVETLKRHNPVAGSFTKVKWHPDTVFIYKESEEAVTRETEV